MSQRLQQLLLFISLFLFTIVIYAMPDLSRSLDVTPLSGEIYNLHTIAFYVCCGMCVAVFAVLIYSLIKFRKSKGAKAAHFHKHLYVEIIWTTIPFLILVVLAMPATFILKRTPNTAEPAMTMNVQTVKGSK